MAEADPPPQPTTSSHEVSQPSPPTYFANIVTCNLNPDDMTMELRRLDIPHAHVLKTIGEPIITLPPPVTGGDSANHSSSPGRADILGGKISAGLP